MGNQLEFDTYREIIDELLQPIPSEGLDSDTLKRLYQSKAVYLENLRIRCFREMNHMRKDSFSREDYGLILAALQTTHSHLRDLVLSEVESSLEQQAEHRKAQA